MTQECVEGMTVGVAYLPNLILSTNVLYPTASRYSLYSFFLVVCVDLADYWNILKLYVFSTYVILMF